MKFIQQCRTFQFPVTIDVIQIRALKERDDLLPSEQTSLKEKHKLSKFKASYNCCVGFVRRQNLKYKTLYGSAGSASQQKSIEETSCLRIRLQAYPTSAIYNVDETALFYKLLPLGS